MVRLRAFGTYDFRIVDVPRFLKEVAGTDHHFRLDEFADTMRSRIVSVFSRRAREREDSRARRRLPLRRAGRGAAAARSTRCSREKYGLEMTAFVVENVSVPPEVEQAIDKRSSHGGGRQPERLRQVPDGAGARPGRQRRRRHGRGARDRHGDGAADDEPARRHRSAGDARRAGARAGGGAGAPELFTPAQVAQQLGVAESDVLASLESGDLKGRRIGTQWRITRAALDAFLQ